MLRRLSLKTFVNCLSYPSTICSQDTFRYEATEYWQDQQSYNECACRDLGPSECKLATFWSTKIKKGICLGMQYKGTTSWIKFEEFQGHGDETLQDKMKGRPVSSPQQNSMPDVEAIAREWRKLLPNPVLEVCRANTY